MADGFDPCECIFSQEQAMQRLINLLRNSQSQCTDSECFQELPGPQGSPPIGGENNFFLLMIGWVVLALALYFMRPNRLRNHGDSKPNNNQGPSTPPPDNSIF